MRIGSSIGLIALGLILALAVNFNVPGLDLELIGWILALVGLVGLIISLVLMQRSRPAARVRETYTVEPDPDPRYRDPNTRY